MLIITKFHKDVCKIEIGIPYLILLSYMKCKGGKGKRSIQRNSSRNDVVSFSNGEIGDVVCIMTVDLNVRIRIVAVGGGGGGCCGCCDGVIVVVLVVVRVRSGDVNTRKAFQGREESGRDGGPHPGSHLIDLLP